MAWLLWLASVLFFVPLFWWCCCGRCKMCSHGGNGAFQIDIANAPAVCDFGGSYIVTYPALCPFYGVDVATSDEQSATSEQCGFEYSEVGLLPCQGALTGRVSLRIYTGLGPSGFPPLHYFIRVAVRYDNRGGASTECFSVQYFDLDLGATKPDCSRWLNLNIPIVYPGFYGPEIPTCAVSYAG